MKKIHVIKNINTGWSVKKNLEQKTFPTFQTQQSAINHAIDQAKTQEDTEVIIHGKSGKIREKLIYGGRNE